VGFTRYDISTTANHGLTLLPIALGENTLYLFSGGYLWKVDLENKTLTEDKTFRDAYSSGCDAFVWRVNKKRNGNLKCSTFVVDYAQSAGSRTLKMRDFELDPTDFTVTLDSEVTLSGDAIFAVFGKQSFPLIHKANTILVTNHGPSTNATGVAVVDLMQKSYDYHVITTSYADYGCYYIGFYNDRTTGNVYLLFKVYYWIVGSYAIVSIVDPKTMTSVEDSQAIDTGCGDYAFPKTYVGTDGKVRTLIYGISGDQATYTTKFNSVYVDNGSLEVEFTRTIDSTYRDYTSGASEPYILGTTTDGYLAVLLKGKYGVSNITTGMQLIKTDSTFAAASTTKVTSSTVTLSSGDTVYNCEGKWTFLSEDDWCYYHLGGIQNGVLHLYKLDLSGTGITIDEDDPYCFLTVPTTGLTPTTLTLTVTKV